jgi:hypothetical protein
VVEYPITFFEGRTETTTLQEIFLLHVTTGLGTWRLGATTQPAITFVYDKSSIFVVFSQMTFVVKSSYVCPIPQSVFGCKIEKDNH